MDELGRLRSALSERYTIERELGRGGTATVYLARDLKHDRLVALKVLRPELAAAVGAERFLREIRISARLQHPNILPLHDSGESDALLFYVMPYVEGESLRERLERESQLPLDEALQIAGEVADALSHAHGQGIIHRDIKPGNILLSGGHAVIADFGIARAIGEAGGERVTESGHTVGTPAYMSPEQATGEVELDARSDIYALGCVVYEMLAGEPPFTGRTARSVLTRHMVETPPSIQALRPSVPPPVAHAIDRALAKAPADRYSTASEFAKALRGAAQPDRRPSLLRRSRASWMVGSALAALVPLLVYAGLKVIRAGTPDLDPNKVVVFPLADRTVEAGEAGSGWDVAIAIGAALEHTDPLKWIDGWSRLPEPLRRNPAQLTAEVIHQISRDRGARYYIEGVMTRDRDFLRVTLRLHDVLGDSLITQASAQDPPDVTAFPQVGLRAVARLLPSLLDPGREIALSALTDRKPAAIALWIQGERAYRQAHFLPALEFYRKSVEQDSQLVFAAVKGAQAASWKARLSEAEDLISLALAHDSLLPIRYLHLAHGLAAYFSGQADVAVSRLREALSEDPDWAEAAMALGEVYYHLLPSEPPPESLVEARFREAAALDSSFTPPLVHLAEIALRRGDLLEAQEILERLEEVDPDSAVLLPLSFMAACIRDGPDGVPWGALARANSGAVLHAAKQLSPGGSQNECATGGFRAVLASTDANSTQKWGALVGLQSLLIAQNRISEARALLDSAVSGGTSAAMSLYVFDAVIGAAMDSGAANAARVARQAAGEDYERSRPQTRWLLGLWHLRQGELLKADRIFQTLQQEATETGSPVAALAAEALSAHLSVARGDTLSAIRALQDLRPIATPDYLQWGLLEPLAVERVLLAQLLLARGQYSEAHRVASVLDHQQPAGFLPLVPASLHVRLRAAEALDEEKLGRLHRQRLLALGRSDLIDSAVSD